jgi:beta-1,4-mannosyltransferase
MLSLRLGSAHPLVRIVRWYEGAIGRRADLHLFVSRAMQAELGVRWRLAGIVFRDRPAESFRLLTAGERDRIRAELRARLNLAAVGATFAMAVSPTSWTVDEDFALLLEAATLCEALIRSHEASGSRFPELLILLTGRGPLRQLYERQMAARPSSRIQLRTTWLDPDEYPRVLAAADLGLCLHRSASGVDLPMKVADMFGAGIPVCALDYGALSEVVQHDVNGLLFSTADGLARALFELFKAFPVDDRQLGALRRGVSAAQSERWQAAWTRDVWPVVSSRSRVRSSL